MGIIPSLPLFVMKDADMKKKKKPQEVGKIGKGSGKMGKAMAFNMESNKKMKKPKKK
jgi:3-methyladenine DNA glycosylase Mpg